ncbi:50S ribosomal protein L31 [Salininema proteolyticum]|uniref:Large ribosomal subunit protein bL31 n=1 Tax=Salininema proteolyticum TaxID=1607685 RepID=A0ABV8TZ01_9ACTN
MKQGIHPDYVETEVSCSCGNSFTTRSTVASGKLQVGTCSACHPFYTGKQKEFASDSRVAKFKAKYAKVKK